MGVQRAVQVLEREAGALLSGVRCQILELVRDQADSSAGMAPRLGLPRQRVNYHVRELEKAGLVEETGTRRRRGLTERLVRASAAYYLISPRAAADPGRAGVRDRFSAAYLLAVAARTARSGDGAPGEVPGRGRR